MLKKNMINAYKNNAQISKKADSQPIIDTPSIERAISNNDKQKTIYRSERDEKLIKDYHFAKFQKNLDQLKNNESLQSLIDKEDWSEDDIALLLKNLR